MLEFAVLSTLALALMIAANVIARQLFGHSIPDVIILVRELMIPTIMFPLAAATANRCHVAVTFLTDRMSPRARGAMIVMGWGVAILAMVPLLYAGGRSLISVWNSHAFYDGQLGLPRWPMKAAFFLGLLMMTVRLAIVAVQDLAALINSGEIAPSRLGEEG